MQSGTASLAACSAADMAGRAVDAISFLGMKQHCCFSLPD